MTQNIDNTDLPPLRFLKPTKAPGVQVAERIKKSDWEAWMGQNPVTDSSFGPVTSSGTYVILKVRGKSKLFLVTDLTPPKIAPFVLLAAGQNNITIPAGARNSATVTAAQNLNVAGVQTLKSAFASITPAISGSGELLQVDATTSVLLNGSILLVLERGPLILDIPSSSILNAMSILDPTTGGLEYNGASPMTTDAAVNGYGAQITAVVNWAAIGTFP